MALVYMNGFESRDSAYIPMGTFVANGRYGSGYSWQLSLGSDGFFFIPIYNNLTQFTIGFAYLRATYTTSVNLATMSSTALTR